METVTLLLYNETHKKDQSGFINIGSLVFRELKLVRRHASFYICTVFLTTNDFGRDKKCIFLEPYPQNDYIAVLFNQLK